MAKKTIEHIKEQLSAAQELIPDTYDGSYELMEETISAYSRLEDYSILDYNDLNLVYRMSIITSRHSIEKKKESVTESHLKDEDKKRLLKVLDKVWQKALQDDYENDRDGGSPSVGMFGTGLYSFVNKTNKESVQAFIKACVDIQKMTDDDAMFDCASQVLNDSFKGMGSAAASQVLHCLKPFTFPIINSNSGYGNIYEVFGIELKKKSSIGTYIDNCRIIKTYRDDHYSFKNYRVFDLAARELGQDDDIMPDEDDKIAWLLNWNPKNFEWDDYEEACQQTREGEPYVAMWSTQSKKTVKGDGAFLIKVGEKPRGILAHGIVIEDAVEDEHFDPEQAAAGKKSTYITVAFDRILDYENEAILNQEVLNDKIPNQQWSPQGSGIRIKEPGLKILRQMWQNLIGDDNKKYWPSLELYDPGISKDEYKQCISDSTLVKYDSLDTVYLIYQSGGEASCKQLEKQYGGSVSHYNANAQNVARWIAKETGCPKPETGEDYSKNWPILFVGRDTENGEAGSWIWKLREPLEEAIRELDHEGFFEELKNGDEKAMKDTFEKNMILYGPPGTGKTYNSIIYAVSICDGRELEDVQNENYSSVLNRYKELRREGRIAFTTFHQSYGYEEFIEGIKPVMDEDNESNDVNYSIEDGVFKRFCDRAKEVEVTSPSFDIRSDATIWKIIIASGAKNNVKDECFLEGNMRIGFDLDEDADDASVREFVQDMEPGDIVLSFKTRETIDGIGIIEEGEPDYLPEKSEYRAYRPVRWIATDIDENILSINNGKKLHRMTVSRVPHMTVEDIIAVAVKYNNSLTDTIIEKNTKPYVFIIDEINRGNISKIFGELITLIETTKRKGAKEAMAATLPYSQSGFSVPDNVYIIGTMNTADRSIALMDTALRRRFDFVEMMPETDVLERLGIGTIAVGESELNVAKMLDVINTRIEYLFDREHTIGHAFFTKLADDASLETLAGIFEKNVIPLLQEYFYEDYEKIQLVLGDNSKDDEFKFVLDRPLIISEIFNGNPDIDLPEKNYRIQKEAFLKLESYKQIGEDL